MSVTFTNNASQWNEIILANPDGGNVLQSKEFAEQKAESGWIPRFIQANGVALTVLERNIPIFGKLWYCPKGPGVTSTDELQKLLPELADFAKQHGVFAIKIDPNLPASSDLESLGLTRYKPIQHTSTVLLNLSPPLEAILAALPQKGRHAVRRAERDGVTIRHVASSDENCDTMYSLLAETAKHAKYPIRSAEYYKKYYQRFSNAGIGQLFFAYVGDTPIAGAYALCFGTKSLYIFGASAKERTTYGGSHLLQWHVITWAKQRGSLQHDLGGTPPSARINDPTHPLYGVGRFKTSFNKEVTDFIDAYDIPVRKLRAALWHAFFEKAARRLYFTRHRQSFY